MNRDRDPADQLLERVGRKVRALRASRGMTRKMLASDSGVSERYLAQLEQGRGNASIGLLQRIARSLRTELAELVREDDDATPEMALIGELVQAMDRDEQHRALQLLYRNFSKGRNCNRIALVGMRGAGKTSLGCRLAEHLGVPFVQLVSEIERVGGMPVGEILTLSGQEGYRRLEEKALYEVLAKHEKCIIETGGSIVSETRLLSLLMTTCHVVWVKALPEEHMQRVIDQGDLRPMESHDDAMADLRRILEARAPFYAQAHTVIDTSARTLEASFQQLLTALSNKCAPPP